MDLIRTIERIQRLRSGTHKFKRKVGLVLIAAVFSIFVIGALVIWAGVASVKYLVAETKNLSIGQMLPGSIAGTDCMTKAKNLLGVQVWLERPFGENLAGLTQACLSTKPQNQDKPETLAEPKTIEL